MAIVLKGLMMGKWLLLFVGHISLLLGVVGIVLPLLPTTPFLLLTAFCYYKASPRAYEWLLSNKYLGSYIENFQSGRGIPLRVKIYILLLLWLSISYSAFVLISWVAIKVLLICIAVAVSVYIYRLPTYVKPVRD